jgi:hypothetical protein
MATLNYRKSEVAHDRRWIWQLVALSFTAFAIFNLGSMAWPHGVPIWQRWLWDSFPLFADGIVAALNLLISLRRPRKVGSIALATVNLLIALAISWAASPASGSI